MPALADYTGEMDLYRVKDALRDCMADMAVMYGIIEEFRATILTRLQAHQNIRNDDSQYEDPEEWELRELLSQIDAILPQ